MAYRPPVGTRRGIGISTLCPKEKIRCCKGVITGFKCLLRLREGMDMSVTSLLMLNFALSLTIAYYFREKIIELIGSIEEVEGIPSTIIENLNSLSELAVPELPLDEIREEIMGIMQEMRPPSFVDHIGGAFASILQAKAMSQMQQFQPDLLMPDAVDGD